MPERPTRFSRFRSDVRKIVAEIEKYVGVKSPDDEREYRFQCDAFNERRDQAQQLTDAIATDEISLWNQRDGDAQRIHDSLRLSLDYFRPDS